MRNEGQFELVKDESLSNIVRLLKACTATKDVGKGFKVHAYVLEHKLFENNTHIGTTLVNMYAKCGALSKALRVFEELPVRDVVTWSALIAGYAQHGQGEEALNCFNDMLCEGHSPDAVTFVCALKACGSIKSATKGKLIHDQIVNSGMLKKDIVLGNTVVDMYAKCGALAKARQVLEELPGRNVVTWSALIAGFVQQEQGEEALKCFDDMLHEGHAPDAVTFVFALKACGSTGAAIKGKEIHDKIVNLGMLEKDIVLGNTLIYMYVKCGALANAENVLNELPVRNVVTWSTLIAGYAQQEEGRAALKCFDDMVHEGHSPDVVTFICVLKSCGSIGATVKGEEIHDKIVILGLLEKHIILGNALVDMYVKCGVLTKAQRVLEELRVRNIVTWNTLIAGYAQQGQGEEALKCFDDMLCEGHSPDEVTFACALKACGSIRAAAKGKEVHDMIVSSGLLGKDIMLGNMVVHMYAKCGALIKAQKVLKELPIRNVVTWSALITAYAQQGQGGEALKCFDDMLNEGHSPDAVTFISALKACGSIGTAAKGEELYEKLVSLGMLKKDVMLGNSVVDMYAKCGALAKAHQVLKELPIREVITWNALLAGYAQQGQGEEALKCFDDMLREGHSPDVVTFICVLKACGSVGAIAKCKEIHEMIVSLGMLKKDIMLGNTLVDTYAKCGALFKAQCLLEELPVRNVVTWSSLIAGYAQQGQSLEVINCFERMLSDGVMPDSLTLTSVLNACNHSGLLDQAETYFSEMSTKYGINPDSEHNYCMTDLFCRAGKFNKALSLIAAIPSDKCLSSWVTLLGASRKWGDVKVARIAFERVLNLDKSNVAVYVLMADIYTAANMREEADEVEVMRVANKAWKMPGCCWWTDATGKVHSFVRDTKHAQSQQIHAKLIDLANKLVEEGYSQRGSREDVLCAHTEKLAIACALINTPPRTSICIVKNMQFCVYCHRATTAISKLEKRQIMVRDNNCFHIFEDGRCSCGDY